MKKTISFILSIVLIMTSVNCFAQEAQDNAKNEREVMKILTGNEKEEEHKMSDAIFKMLDVSAKALINRWNDSVTIIGKSVYFIGGNAIKLLGKALGLSTVLLGKVGGLCVYTIRLPFEFYSKKLSGNAIAMRRLKKIYNSLPEESQKEIQALIEKKDAAGSESLQYSCIIDNILKGKSFLDSTSYCLKNLVLE